MALILLFLILAAAAFAIYWFVIKEDSETTPSPGGGTSPSPSPSPSPSGGETSISLLSGTTPVLIEPSYAKLQEWAVSIGTGTSNNCLNEKYDINDPDVVCTANCHDGGNALSNPYYPTPWIHGPTIRKTAPQEFWNIEYASETIPLTEDISKADYCKELIE